MRVIQLGNTANWPLLHSANVDAVTYLLANGLYKAVPIPDIDIPIVIDSFILVIRVDTSVPPGKEWNFAGVVKQKISTGITIGGGQDGVRVQSQPLFLNQSNLIFFEKISASYSISIKVPKWFTNAIVTIWEYTGVDTTDEVQLLQEINSKV